MSRSVEDRLQDIRLAIARCLRYAEHLSDGDHHLTEMASDAIERNIAIIGEAAKHLPAPVLEALPEVDWPAVRGMRNILVHEYFGIDQAIVMDVIDNELRALDAALAAYMQTEK